MKYFYIKDFGAPERQSSGLLLFITPAGRIVGICDEDDSATYDLRLVGDPNTANDASWFSWNESLEAAPASWSDILNSGLVNQLTGIIIFEKEKRSTNYIVFSEVGHQR